jgi:protein TonB
MRPLPIIRPEILHVLDPIREFRPEVGIPVPRPDAAVPGDQLIATQRDKERIVSGVPGGTGTGGKPGPDVGGICDGLIAQLPPPNVIMSVEENPVVIKRVLPEYPALAAATGLSGEVLVRVLIDQKGKVRDVLIARASGSDVGFEEAALAALRQWLFKPASNNHQPVAVWINIPIRFELD